MVAFACWSPYFKVEKAFFFLNKTPHKLNFARNKTWHSHARLHKSLEYFKSELTQYHILLAHLLHFLTTVTFNTLNIKDLSWRTRVHLSWRTPEHLSWRTREPEITSAQMETISFGELENTSVGELENISVWFFPCSPNLPHICQFFTQLQFEANPIETQSHTQQKCVNHEVQCFSLHSVIVIVIWVLPGGGRTRLWRGKVSGVGFSSQRQNLTYLRNMIESTYFILKQREKEIHLL